DVRGGRGRAVHVGQALGRRDAADHPGPIIHHTHVPAVALEPVQREEIRLPAHTQGEPGPHGAGRGQGEQPGVVGGRGAARSVVIHGTKLDARGQAPVKLRCRLDPALMGRPDIWRMGTAEAVVRRRGLVLVCWAGALALLAPHATGVERVLETAARVDGSESARVEAELASRFRAPFAQYALLVVRGASPLTPAGRELGDSIRDAVAAVPGVAAVRGYRDGRDTLLLGRDSSGTFVLVGLDAAAGRPDAIVPQLRAATAALARRLVGRFPELELRWTGETVLNADLRQASRASARVAERRALPLTMALLLVAFGSLVAAGAPVVSGVLVIVLALGASGMLAARWPLSILLQT